MRHVLRPLLPGAALLAALLPMLVAVAPPAGALPVDACMPLDLNDEAAVVERAEKVDDVFVGRVDAVVRRTAAHRVTVTTVLSGDLRLGQKITVVFDRSAEGSKRLLGERETHLFFTRDVGGAVRADYCEGSQELPGGLSAPMQRTLEDYLSGAPEPPARVALHTPDGGTEDPPRLSRIVAPGAAISLVGVLGLFLLARVGRRRA
ncbi:MULTISPECIES: hypothetical protein [Nocardioides]|uniref:Uncharacterized protein n=1 Tax=Nocardioides vastitatis TaxID=2568655 RepID=A0ABW0ZHF2_9ACTN|nr:hypothetical protein [Nocardioides sp.]THJ05767.1 hypothetical protein E7Z54_06800 [Nocardioides sp.]